MLQLLNIQADVIVAAAAAAAGLCERESVRVCVSALERTWTLTGVYFP